MRCLWQSKRADFEDGARLAGRTAPADRNGPTVSKCGPMGGPDRDRAPECRDGGISGGEITYPAGRPRRASSKQAPYPSLPRKRESSLILLLLLSPRDPLTLGSRGGPGNCPVLEGFTYPAGRPRRAAPCLPGTPGWRRRRETAEAPPAAEKARLFRGCGPVGGPCGDRAPECRDGGISGGEITYPANKQRRAAPCLPGTPGWRRRRWRCGSSDRQSPAGPRRPRCRRRPRW